MPMMASCGMRVLRCTRVTAKIAAAEEREAERIDVRHARVQVVAREVGHRRAESRDLGKRQVHEDDAPLDDVDTEIGVNPGQDEARDEGGQKDLEGRHFAPPFLAASASVSSLTS